jgi:hypothetical protein
MISFFMSAQADNAKHENHPAMSFISAHQVFNIPAI